MEKSPSSCQFIICAPVISMEISAKPGWVQAGANVSHAQAGSGPAAGEGHGHFSSPFGLVFLTANLQLQTQRATSKAIRPTRDLSLRGRV